MQQLGSPSRSRTVHLRPYKNRKVSGTLAVSPDGSSTLIVSKKVTRPSDVEQLILIPGGVVPVTEEAYSRLSGQPRWLDPAPVDVSTLTEDERHARCSQVRASWVGEFTFQEERCEGSIPTSGLRAPQIGALYATLGYWKTKTDTATIVMPTGTGKTETMLALLAKERLNRLLVVVPTAALREQTAEKFLSFGVLRDAQVIGDGALYPIVGTLEHRLGTVAEVDEFFGACNVVVATMQVISQCDDLVQSRMAEVASHLFIDEAHHVTAQTWNSFRSAFADRTILQFTATPFRTDRKPVSGNIIFNYPLKKAQVEGYFQPITFIPIREYHRHRADLAIAKAAIQQLEADRAAGYQHVVMARAADIERSAEVFRLYQRLGAAHNPAQIHSKLSPAQRREALRTIHDGTARIIVCVNMLGEGFDLPELKIAALHDIHKSLAITLQFTGRFTRTRSDIGSATMIARYPDEDLQEALRELYAEDADWDELLPPLSERETDRQIQRSEFLNHFGTLPSEIPLQNVFPKMSTVVYQNVRAWDPSKLVEVLGEERIYAGPIINSSDRVALVVTQEREEVSWGAIREIYNVTWHLYLVHWQEERQLLYIHSSNKDTVLRDIAGAVAGEDVPIINGERAFRALAGINRLLLMNLGVNAALSRAVRFTMFVGPDIQAGLAEAIMQNKVKSNIFGRGYASNDYVTIGCSHKGRIWSYQTADDLSQWVDWCHALGEKLLDDTISVDQILKDAMVPEEVDQRPQLIPMAVEWPTAVWARPEDTIFIDVAGDIAPLYEVGIELLTYASTGPLRFRVFTQTKSAIYEVQFRKHSIRYVAQGKHEAGIRVSKTTRARLHSLGDWFEENPPIIHFEGRAYLEYNVLLRPKTTPAVPFDPQRIDVWSWTGTNLKRESQTVRKYSDSIQRRVIDVLCDPNHDPVYDIVFDDDDTGEVADVVALKMVGNELIVHLFHCKYSGKTTPGARVDDLYAVCGQAQRSISWRRDDATRLVRHLRCREESRLEKHPESSRFEKGDMSRLDHIAQRAHLLVPNFKIFIVQPGLSASRAEVNQLELLASTELYLQETYAIPFGVIASH